MPNVRQDMAHRQQPRTPTEHNHTMPHLPTAQTTARRAHSASTSYNRGDSMSTERVTAMTLDELRAHIQRKRAHQLYQRIANTYARAGLMYGWITPTQNIAVLTFVLDMHGEAGQ